MRTRSDLASEGSQDWQTTGHVGPECMLLAFRLALLPAQKVTMFARTLPAGLAPHHDDVELFICQTSGTKRWRLYAPRGGFRLPGESSADLDAAELGEPIAEITLKARTTLRLVLLGRPSCSLAQQHCGSRMCSLTQCVCCIHTSAQASPSLQRHRRSSAHCTLELL